MDKKHLVVIGAGYAGANIINNLKNDKNLKITLINETAYHLHQTDIHRYISGSVDFSEVAFSLESFASRNNFTFKEARVEDANFDKKELSLSTDEKISYDYLVIASGNVSFYPRQIENIMEYASDIKKLNPLKEKREEFLKLIETPQKGKNIAIVGGGLSGVEIALEFALVLKQRNIKEDECSVTLVEQFKEVLPNMDPFLVSETTKRCDELNVKRVHGEFVTKAADNKLFLGNGEEIPFNMSIFVIGVTGEKFVKDEEFEVNVKNQFFVDEYLRLNNHKDVFVIGDIAQTKDKNDNYVLPTAQMAKLHADLTAKNIKNSMKNASLIKNDLETKGVMVDLCGGKAVGIVAGFKVKGFIAYFLKRFVSNTHKKIFS